MEVALIELPSGRWINVADVRSFDPGRSGRLDWRTGAHELLPEGDSAALLRALRGATRASNATAAKNGGETQKPARSRKSTKT